MNPDNPDSERREKYLDLLIGDWLAHLDDSPLIESAKFGFALVAARMIGYCEDGYKDRQKRA